MFEDEKFENGIGDEYNETIDDGMEEGYGEYTEEALDTNGDGIDDFRAVDYDGDGEYDMMAADTDYDGYAESLDTNGDGYVDRFTSFVDFDGDGVADQAVTEADTSGDGLVDIIMVEIDTDGNGYIDSVEMINDYNRDGNADDITLYTDTNDDGIVDAIYNEFDSDYNGAANAFTIALDLDSDGEADYIEMGETADTDGDGFDDAYVHSIDEDGDGIYDIVETYGYSENAGILELSSVEPITWTPDTVYVEEDSIYDDYENYDPDTADAYAVSGNPEESMDEWEYQGDTNRCALYTQMFVIEEVTDEDIDMEDFADLAEEHGWFDEEGGTSVLNMNKMLDYYGIENEMSFNNDIDDIKDCLDNGGKVIVSIDADEIWYEDNDNMFTPGESANHAVEVIGIDYSDPENPMVILNDPGHPDGCGAMVPVDDFVDAWEDGNCQMIECM